MAIDDIFEILTKDEYGIYLKCLLGDYITEKDYKIKLQVEAKLDKYFAQKEKERKKMLSVINVFEQKQKNNRLYFKSYFNKR